MGDILHRGQRPARQEGREASAPWGAGRALASVAAGIFLTSSALANDASNAIELKRLVHQDCGSCHGLTLKGGLGPDIRPQTIEHYDREVLTGVILDGIEGTAMPPWRPLITEEEAVWIADYLLKGE